MNFHALLSPVNRGCLAALALISLSLTACTDDLGVKNENVVPSQGLTIYIPNPQSAAEYGLTRTDGGAPSRATVAASADEARINRLWLCAYPTGEEGETLVTDIKPSLKNSETNPDYKECSVKLVPGKYNFYFLANLDEYVDQTIDHTLSEETVKTMVLNFSNFSSKGIYPSGQTYLPMACLANEVTYGDSKTKAENDGIPVDDKTVVYADLTFLMAKVRYTVLFDREGISSSFPNSKVDFSGASISNVRKEYALTSAGTITDLDGELATISDADFSGCAYPAADSPYITKNFENVAEPLGEQNWTDGSLQKAWQGIVYLPVNESEKVTTLTVTPDGADMKDSYQLKLGKDEKLQRGKFYEMVVGLKTSTAKDFALTVNVSQWSLQNLSYNLHGPYELILEKSKIGVSSKQPAVFWYKSDVAPGKISFTSPQIEYTYKEVTYKENFYSASVYKNEKGEYIRDEKGHCQIEVKVNPVIPFEVLDKVNNSEDGFNKEDYMWLEVEAGNIRKMLTVEPLELTPYLKVSPNHITVNVEEYTASGINNAKIKIEYETNVDGSIKIKDDSGLFSIAGLGEGALKVTGNYSVDGSEITLNDKVGELELEINGILAGKKFWQQSDNISFTLSVDRSDVEDETVNVKVKPYTTDYVIYFRDKDGKWNSPHIYVYQCLEMPNNLDGQYKDRNGMTVGYQTNGSYMAALEYSFTGNIAFKGWKGYGGPDKNDPYYNWIWFDQGFIIFRELQQDNSGSDPTYNPANKNTERYNIDIDFNRAHKANIESSADKWLCDKCKNGTDLKITWPGFVMEKVVINGITWFRYTLSGVATPGKALVMFANGHDHDAKDFDRFPAANHVGVPLFDFTDHIGWLEFNGNVGDYEGNYFVDDNPYGEGEVVVPEPGEKNYVDYWLRGIDTWDYVSDAYRFYETGITDEWRTDYFHIDGEREFKIGNADWSISIANETNGSKWWINELNKEWNLYNRCDANLLWKLGSGDFYAVLKKTGENTYTLTIKK